uniref:myosin-4-like isoform X1 n=1 Tax=Styela clava TaxID=7725 RepID=UPI0019395015|nr:myosin-4-like isoform X1 [Styela clava]
MGNTLKKLPSKENNVKSPKCKTDNRIPPKIHGDKKKQSKTDKSNRSSNKEAQRNSKKDSKKLPAKGANTKKKASPVEGLNFGKPNTKSDGSDKSGKVKLKNQKTPVPPIKSKSLSKPNESGNVENINSKSALEYEGKSRKPSPPIKNAKAQCLTKGIKDKKTRKSDSSTKTQLSSPKSEKVGLERIQKISPEQKNTSTYTDASTTSTTKTIKVKLLKNTGNKKLTKKRSVRNAQLNTVKPPTDENIETTEDGLGQSHNIMIMVDEWKKEEEKLQKEYENAQERIRTSLREEHQAKAQAQTWRARLERLAVAHREKLFRQATLLRARLRSAEHRLVSTEKRAKKLVVTNSKLKGMIDVVKEEARSLRVESEKKRESARKELNEKLVSVEGDLRKLKERLKTSGMSELKSIADENKPAIICAIAGSGANNECDISTDMDADGHRMSEVHRKKVSPQKLKKTENLQTCNGLLNTKNAVHFPIPPTYIPTPSVNAFGFPPPSVLCGPAYSRYVSPSYVSYPPLTNSYASPPYMTGPSYPITNASLYQDIIPPIQPCFTMSHNKHRGTRGNRTVPDRYLGATLGSAKPRQKVGHQMEISDRLYNNPKNSDFNTNILQRIPCNRDLNKIAMNSQIKDLRVKDTSGRTINRPNVSSRRQPIRIPTAEIHNSSTNYDTSSASNSTRNPRCRVNQQYVVSEREVYNAYARSRHRPNTFLHDNDCENCDPVPTDEVVYPTGAVHNSSRKTDESPHSNGEGNRNELDSGAIFYKGISTEKKQNGTGTYFSSSLNSGKRNLSHTDTPSVVESAPTPYNERGYFGDFERSASTLEVARKRRIIGRRDRKL